MSWLDLESLLGAAIYFASGTLVLVFVYGRGLLQLEDSLGKSILIRVVFAACTIPCTLVGYWRGIDWWLVVPAAVWVCGACVETQRLVLKYKHRADRPVEEDVPPFSLFRPFTTTQLAVRRYEVRVPQWKEGRMRIAHISDIHAHNTLRMEYYHSVMARVKEWKPDTVFVTGDFVSRVKYASILPDVLAGLDAPLGVFGSLGNHDYWSDEEAVRSELGKTNVQLLGSEGRVLEAGGGDKLLVSGCDDPWSAQKWSAPELEQNVPMAVLSHTADNIYSLNEAGAMAVFSGHFHAGQASVPWYGSVVVPSKYGRRFDHGHFSVNGTHLYVTAGVGAAFPPFRVYCHPEIIIVDLVPGA